MSNTAQPKRWPPERADNAEDTVPVPPTVAPNVVPIRIDAGHDPLDSFNSEDAPAAPPLPPSAASSPSVAIPPAVKTKWLIGFGACFAIAAMAAAAFFARGREVIPPPTQASPLSGHAVLNSRPDGAVVIVDGVSRGVTPLDLELSAGMHEAIFRVESSERRIALKVDGGTRVSENVDVPVGTTSSGALEIVSDPSGARVTVDGTAVGSTPLTLRSLTPARHSVTVTQGSTVVTRGVEVSAGATASVFVSLTPQGGATGMLAVESLLELRILENGRLLGLSNGAPIAVTSGKHQFELVNDALEVRLSRSATVEAGKSTRMTVGLPNGTLSVNASPWAEVFVDGRTVGVTPLGSLSLAIGSHEIVWRHPQLGERRQTVVVGAQTPTRVTTDLNR
jgi:hypothetical protein